MGGTKDPDIGAIVALAPDLVVVNDEENRREDADALGAAGLAVHVTHVHSVGDVGPCLDDLAAAVGADRPLPSLPVAVRPHRDHVLWHPDGSQTTWSGRRRAAGVRPDLATAVDDDERRHLRVVGAGRPGHRQRVRRRGRALSDDDPRRRRRPAARAGAGADRALPLQGAPPPGAPRRSRPTRGSSTVRTCSGGASGRRRRWSGSLRPSARRDRSRRSARSRRAGAAAPPPPPRGRSGRRRAGTR